MSTGARKRIWLLQDGEPLPTDDNPRLMRTGTLAEKLVDAGFDVTWWTSSFQHSTKRYRSAPPTVVIGPHYRLRLLHGPPYESNLSVARVRHYRRCAAAFTVQAAAADAADLVLGSYPSPELCEAGLEYASRRRIPFVVDIRDPWPDIFAEYFPLAFRPALRPALWHYRRRIARIARGATGIVAVSRAMLDWGLAYAGRAQRETDRVIYIGFHAAAAHPRVLPAAFSAAHPLRCALVSSCGRSYDGDAIIDAARALHAAGDNRVHLAIVGDGEMRPRWRQRAAGLSNVSFPGFLDHGQLQAEMAHTHIGLILMRGGITRFWLGNKIFEYLAASLGIVNNIPGEAAAIVAQFQLGLSIPPGDGASLAKAVTFAAENPAAVARWMQNAERVFPQHFDRRRVYHEYVEYLARLLAS